MTAVIKINRWGIGAGVAALALAVSVGGVTAQQKAPEPPKDAAKTVAPPKDKAPAKPAPVAKKPAPPPACNTIKDKAGCEARKDDCDWIAEAVIEKGARKGQKQAAYCRKLPAKKPAPAAKAPPKTTAPAPAPTAPKAAAPAAPKAPAPAPAPKN